MATIVIYDPADADVPNRVTHLLTSVHTPDYVAVTDKLVNPDLSAVNAEPTKYWKRDGTDLVVMSTAEKALVDFIDPYAGTRAAPEQYVRPAEPYMKDESKTLVLPIQLKNPVVHAYCPDCLILTNGNLVSPAGSGWDPTNRISNSLTSNINNGSFGDLVYNNQSSGNTSGFIMGIDMGSPTAITAVKKYDYSASYYDTEWEFIGTNESDASSYNVIFTESQTSARVGDNPTFITFPTETYRYYGVRVVTSNNSSFSVISELELYSGTASTVETQLALEYDYDYFVLDASNGTTTIQINNKNVDRDIKLVIMGEIVNA